jgi:hypothetical protein
MHGAVDAVPFALVVAWITVGEICLAQHRVLEEKVPRLLPARCSFAGAPWFTGPGREPGVHFGLLERASHAPNAARFLGRRRQHPMLFERKPEFAAEPPWSARQRIHGLWQASSAHSTPERRETKAHRGGGILGDQRKIGIVSHCRRP